MVEYNETEYVFLPDYVDRLVHTLKSLGGYSGDIYIFVEMTRKWIATLLALVMGVTVV